MNDQLDITKVNDNQIDCIETVLSKEQFRDFFTFLNIIKSEFIDFCIENGEFKARSNDRSYIVETGFSYFTNIDYCIGDVIELVKLLSRLDKNSKIKFTIEENYIFFNDNSQNIKIGKGNPDFIDNKFVSDKEMEDVFYKGIDKQKQLIDETLPRAIVSNIYKMADDLNTLTVSVKHEKGNLLKGYICVANESSSNESSDPSSREYSIRLKRAFKRPMEMDHYFVLNIRPFIFSKHDMNISCFISKDGRMIMTIYTVMVRNLLINIYSLTAYLKCDE